MAAIDDEQRLLGTTGDCDSASSSVDCAGSSRTVCFSRFIGVLILIAFPVYGGGQAIVSAGLQSVEGPSGLLVAYSPEKAPPGSLLLVLAAYGLGDPAQVYDFGCSLIMLNSAMVAAVGALVYHQLARASRLDLGGGGAEPELVRLWSARVGLVYFLSRLGEGALLGFGGVCYLWISQQDRPGSSIMLTPALAQTCYNVGMVSLSAGSVVMLAFLARMRRSCSVNVPWALCLFGVAGYVCLAIVSGMDAAAPGLAESPLGVCLLVPGALFELLFGLRVAASGLRIERLPIAGGGGDSGALAAAAAAAQDDDAGGVAACPGGPEMA